MSKVLDGLEELHVPTFENDLKYSQMQDPREGMLNYMKRSLNY